MNPHVAVIVLAKQPVPGRVKTRLCPPCTPVEAATIARAALSETLASVEATAARRRILALDNQPPSRLRSKPVEIRRETSAELMSGWEVVAQRGAGLDERLAYAFEDSGAPGLLIGMDTPQVTPKLLDHAMEALLAPGTDAVVGPTPDGGYWAIGLKRSNPRLFLGVPMSTDQTFFQQMHRMTAFGLSVATLPPLVDVDHFSDALAVAEQIPHGEFAVAVGRVAERLEMVR